MGDDKKKEQVLGSQVMMYGMPFPTDLPDPLSPDVEPWTPATKEDAAKFFFQPNSNPQIPTDVTWFEITVIDYTEDKVVFTCEGYSEDGEDVKMEVTPLHLNDVIKTQGLTEKVLGEGLRGYTAIFAEYNDEWVLLALKHPGD